MLHFLIEYTDDDRQKFFVRVQYTSTQHVRNLFFAHPVCFKTLKANPDVVLLDATYKTNKFNMPLLHVVGTNCRKKTYNICFRFIGGESEQCYGWHILKMRELFEYVRAKPKCFVTDNDAALKAALSAFYPDVVQRLCI